MKKTDLVQAIFLMKLAAWGSAQETKGRFLLPLRSQVSRFLRAQKSDIYLRVRMLNNSQNYHNYILTST
jgi:hypothetical protein